MATLTRQDFDDAFMRIEKEKQQELSKTAFTKGEFDGAIKRAKAAGYFKKEQPSTKSSKEKETLEKPVAEIEMAEENDIEEQPDDENWFQKKFRETEENIAKRKEETAKQQQALKASPVPLQKILDAAAANQERMDSFSADGGFDKKGMTQKLQDDKVSPLERLTYATDSIIDSSLATPGVISDTALQAYKEYAANKKNAQYQSSKEEHNKAAYNKEMLDLQALKQMSGGVLPQEKEKRLELLQSTAQKKAQERANNKTVVPLGMDKKSYEQLLMAQQLAQKSSEGMGEAGKFMWDTGLSIADTISTLPTLALSPSAPLAIMGAKSAAGKMAEVGQAGGSATESLLRGAVTGAIEVATEKMPLDSLVAIAKSDIGKNTIRSIVQQMGEEASEETISYVSNYIADKAFSDPNAEFSIKDMALSALGGAVSGGVMGGGAAVFSKTVGKASGENIENEDSTQNGNNQNAVLQSTAKIENDGSESVLADGEPDDLYFLKRGIEKQSEVAVPQSSLSANAPGSATAENLRKAKISAGIDPRTEFEKVVEEQESRVKTANMLQQQNQISQEQAATIVDDAVQKVETAQKRQINLDYQEVDRNSRLVRAAAIKDVAMAPMIESVEKLAGLKGIAVKYFADGDASAPNGFITGGTMHINTADPKVMFKTAVHETMHALKDNNQNEYLRLMNSIQKLAMADDKYNKLAGEVADVYAKELGENATEDLINEEIVCKLCEELVESPDSFFEKIDGDRTVVEWFLDFVRKIKNNIAIALSHSEIAMLDEAERNLVNFMRGESGDGEGADNVRYSLANNAETEVEKVIANRNYNQEVKLRDSTPKTLTDLGVKNLPMLMNAAHIRENILTEAEAKAMKLKFNSGINYHGLGKTLFLQAIDELDSPQRAYRGTKNAKNAARNENYFLIILELKDESQNNINVPVYIHQKGKYNDVFIDTNKMATVFGRNNINRYIENEIKNGNLVKVKATKSIKEKSPIDNDLDKVAYDDIIFNKMENVNTISKNNMGKISSNPNTVKKSLKIDTTGAKGTGALNLKEYVANATAEVNGRTAKSSRLQKQYENVFTDRVSKIFNVPNFDKLTVLKKMVRDMSEGIKDVGYVTDSELNDLFETAYNCGIEVNGDFYEEYSGMKQEIRAARLAPLTGGEYEQFKEKYRNKVFFKEGGEAVDTFFDELNERYPGLLNTDVINEYDKLLELGRAYDGIVKQEQSLNEYLGEYAQDFKEKAREQFKDAADDFMRDVGSVGRYEMSTKKARKEEIEFKNIKITTDELKAANKEVQKLARERDRLVARYPITAEDNEVIVKLLAGTIQLKDVGQNKYAIEQVYKAKKAVEDANKPIFIYKKKRNLEMRERDLSFLATSMGWKDKPQGLRYTTETAERNIRDIVSSREIAQRMIDTYIAPVHISEAEANRMKTKMRDRVLALKMDAGKPTYNVEVENQKGKLEKIIVNEAGLVQLYGEKLINENVLSSVGANEKKIVAAATEMRKIYDELLDMMNETLIRNGYAPVEKRADYFTHFEGEENDSLLKKLMKKTGFDSKERMPTKIAGKTHTFKPGKTWFGKALARNGAQTTYNALEGFDQYLDGAADVIFQTDNIQNLRSLENSIRYMYSEESMQAQLDSIEAMDIDEHNKLIKRGEIEATDMRHLGHFVTWLQNYTNTLANKKSLEDRTMEYNLGRGMYTLSKNSEIRVAANMVAVNLQSAMTNFIPIVQATGEVKTKYLLKGMEQTMATLHTSDGFEDLSDFLTNRNPSTKLCKTGFEKWSSNLSAPLKVMVMPMEYIDKFTSNVVVRAKYLQNLDEGMTSSLAMMGADSFGASLIADRSKGAQPLVFNAKNPLHKAFTMFQLEQNNQIRYLVKDLPYNLRDRGIGAIAAALFKYMVCSWLFNNLYEMLAGRRPALDPIDLIYSAVADFSNPKISTDKALGNTGMNIVQELPFVGEVFNGGRLPIGAAVPNVFQLAKILDGEVAKEKKLAIAKKELSKPIFYMLPPVAGGQMKKMAEAAEMLIIDKGVSYSINNAGEKKVQYAVDTKNIAKAMQMLAFGKWSTKEAQEYVDSGFQGMSKGQSAAFTAIKENDRKIGNKDAQKIVEDAFANADGTVYETKDGPSDGEKNTKISGKEAKAYLDKKGYLSKKQKYILFREMCPTIKAENNPYA